VFVNDKQVDESEYLPRNLMTSNGNFLKPGEKVTVPPGEIFVMGDNRNASSDSREWGFVTREEIIGKSMVVYWPPSEFKFVHAATYGK
jgi:signal peptidase I